MTKSYDGYLVVGLQKKGRKNWAKSHAQLSQIVIANNDIITEFSLGWFPERMGDFSDTNSDKCWCIIDDIQAEC